MLFLGATIGTKMLRDSKGEELSGNAGCRAARKDTLHERIIGEPARKTQPFQCSSPDSAAVDDIVSSRHVGHPPILRAEGSFCYGDN